MTNHSIEDRLLQITNEFLTQLRADSTIQSIQLSASLEQELGIDSIGKAELFQRIEKSFGIRLPENAMSKVQSLQDIIPFIQHSTNKPIKKPNLLIQPLTALHFDMSGVKNLLEVIQLHGLHNANRPHIYFQDEEGKEHIIHYGDLLKEATAIATGLHWQGIKPGETIAIMLPTSPEFFYVFCGVILAGAVAVPIYPPFRPDQIEEYIKREANILQNAQVRILITFSTAEILSRVLRTFIPSLKAVMTVKNLMPPTAMTLPSISVDPTDGVLIQYTSGSTGDPKGVYLTHANMLANIRAIGTGLPIKSSDVSVSWLPLYHDMGLMTWLASLYYGIPLTIMSPLVFLTRPEKWLWSIHYHRATLSGGPNFAYELCAKKIDLKDLEGLDLSSWRFAFNGAEAINPKTLKHFSDLFAPFGFKPEMFAPVYGLAESTVALTFPKHIRAPLIDKVLRDPFQLKGEALPASKQDKDIFEFVACGEALPDHSIRIVNDIGDPIPERHVGNLQFQGPSSMQGYYHRPEATKKIYHNGWWDTGDLAYIANEELFIVGRKKDVIIKAGRNIYPEEIEEVIGQIPGIRKGCVIAFGIVDAQVGTEKLIIVAESYEKNREKRLDLQTHIIQQMSRRLNTPPDEILLVPVKTIPKTSSGKLQRAAAKTLYLNNTLVSKKLSASLQLAKLIGQSLYKNTINALEKLLRLFYAIYIGLLLTITFPFLYIGILCSTPRLAAIIVKYWARAFLHFAGCPVEIKGKKYLHQKKNTIYVCNHASYIDAILLTGILPCGTIFTIKKELFDNAFLRGIIKKLQYLPIDRTDFTKSLENKKSIITTITDEKKSLVIFPEGTFTYATGLRPFKLGAFTIAVETGTAICPIAINGTRKILRGDTFLPKPGKISVHIGKWICPNGTTWDDVLDLHSQVRKEIAAYCGEPVIDMIAAGLSKSE